MIQGALHPVRGSLQDNARQRGVYAARIDGSSAFGRPRSVLPRLRQSGRRRTHTRPYRSNGMMQACRQYSSLQRLQKPLPRTIASRRA
jgi:hypothetical protein